MKSIYVLLPILIAVLSCGTKDEAVVVPKDGGAAGGGGGTSSAVDTGGTGGGGTAALTYTNSAKAILDAKCVTCHKLGGPGAFLLLNTHAAAAAAKDDIVRTSTGATVTMPKTGSPQLTADEKKALADWVGAGAPN